MTTAIAIPNLADMRRAQSNLAKSVAPRAGFNGRELLRLDYKTAIWLIGQDNDRLGTASIAVNPASFCHGIIAWDENAPIVLGEAMRSVAQPPPLVSEQVNPSLAWSTQVSFEAAVVSGPDKGTQVLYKSSSMGGCEFGKALFDAICDQLEAEPDRPVPVMTLGYEEYRNKRGGTTYKPTFDILAWEEAQAEKLSEPASDHGYPDEPEQVPGPEPEPAPTRQRISRRRS